MVLKETIQQLSEKYLNEIISLRRHLHAHPELSFEEYNLMLESQGNTCAICKQESVTSLCVDHCHKSGDVRGILCSNCNAGLGMFKDDPNILKKAINYLNKHIDTPSTT